MSVAERRNSAKTYVIDEAMNDHGTVTLRARATPATYHVVEYDDDSVRELLGELPEGSRVSVSLSRTGCRANVWTAAPATV